MLGRSTWCSKAKRHLQAGLVTGVVVSIMSILAAPAMAGYSSFVFVAQADSPGNDYKRIGSLTFDECVNRCDADTACNAFTYNELKRTCFLKSAAAQWTILTLGAITGIRLSPFSLEGDTRPDQSSVPDGKKQ
jgi:PAN domain